MLTKDKEELPKTLKDFVRPYILLFAASFTFLIISNGLGLIIPKLNSSLLDTFIDTGHIDKSVYYIAGVILVVCVAATLRITINGIIGESIAYDIRNALLRKVANLEYLTVNKRGLGKLLTLITNDTKGVKDIFNWGLDSIIGAVFFLIGSIVMMALINPGLLLRVLLIVPVLIIGFIIVFTKARTLFVKSQEVLDSFNRLIDENIKASSLVRVFVGELREVKKFLEQNLRAKEIGIEILNLFALLIPVITFASNLGILLIVWFGGGLVIKGELSYGEFTAFNSYVALFIFPIIMIGFLASGVGRASATFGRIKELLNTEETFKDGKQIFTTFESLKFSDVGLTFGKKKKVLLQDIDLEIKKGQKIGIMGSTGSGKSMILNILLRFRENTSGTVLLNDKDLRDYKIATVRNKIAWVFQENFLFNGTVRQNVVLGSEHISEADFHKAVTIAQVDEFVKDFPNKYEEIVGERGVTLSGGQKQRICIARALINNPQMIILDDSTSSLDIVTEEKILKAMKKEYPHITIIVISQKVNSIKNCDKIYIVNEGLIESSGTHKELVNKSILYQEIISSQKAA